MSEQPTQAQDSGALLDNKGNPLPLWCREFIEGAAKAMGEEPLCEEDVQTVFSITPEMEHDVAEEARLMLV